MSSSKEYLDFVLEMLPFKGEIDYRYMMGEYVIYYKGKIIGGIYDDRFLIKNTPCIKNILTNIVYEIPYKGAKEMILLEDNYDKEFLKELIEKMYIELPERKPKKKKEKEIFGI